MEVKNNNRLRLSYTLLNLWRQGRFDDALIYYFKMARVVSPAMEAGLKFDEYLNNYILEHDSYPIEWGGDKLTEPQVQVKWEYEYSEHFDLVGVLDAWDGTTIYENKTGSSKDSADYANDFQIPIYFILAKAKGVAIDKAIIKHYNQHLSENQFDQSIVYNTPKEIERGRNFIETIGGEIYHYFEENNLFKPKVPLDK
jgi:hypothetical protein